MPQGYRNNSLADNPYVGIDVDYFDKKALEKQQRHDVARENYSKFVQDVANQPFLDEDSRNQYLKEQQQNFDNVLTKYSGNLSAGYQDILGSIEQSRLSPYHNVNKRAIEQDKLRQDLTSQYGSDAIDLSNIPTKLYQRDKDGKVQWVNPDQIGAKVVKADDYGKIIEDMLKDTAAHEYQTQSGIGGGSGNAYYLMSRIIKGEVLSPQELMQISKDPSVQKAFLANATTAGVDNRQVPGSNQTYKEMLTNPDGLAQFIYGNIQDKQRNNQFESKQFMQNVGAVEGLRNANRMKADKVQADYTQYLKKVNEAGLTFDVPIGNKKLNSNSLNEIKKNADMSMAKESQLSTNIYTKAKEIHDLLGFVPQPGKPLAFGDIVNLKTSDNKLDRNKVQELLNKKYGINPSADMEGIRPDIKEKMQDDLTMIENRFMEVQGLEHDRRDAYQKYIDRSNLLNSADDSIRKQTFNELKQDGSFNDKLKQYNINSPDDIQNFLNNSRIVAAESPGFYTKVMQTIDDIKDSGIELDQVYKVLANESETAMPNRWNKTLSNKVSEIGVDKVLGMFLNSEGKDLGSSTMLSRDRSWYNPRRYSEGNIISLQDKLKELKEAGNSFKLESYIASPDATSKGITQHLKIKVLDPNGKEVPDSEIFLPEVKLSSEYKNLEKEISIAGQTEAYNGYLTESGYKKENIDRANIQTGQTVAGDKISDAIGDLSNENVYKKDYNVPFSLPNGEETAIKIYKDVDGFYGLIGIDGKVVKASDGDMPYKTKNPEDIQAAANSLVGEAYYIYNPNIHTEQQRIPRSTFNNNTSYSNYVFSKRNFDNTTTQVEGNSNEESEE